MKNSMNNSKESLQNFKYEVASELGVDLQDTQLTAKEAGSVRMLKHK